MLNHRQGLKFLEIIARLDRIEELLKQMAPGNVTPMGPGMMAVLSGGIEGLREQNKQRAAAQRAVKRKNKKGV